MDAYRRVLRSKIHRATVTQADLHYEGSVTIPPELLEAAGIAAYEAVHVWNVTSGTRFETYAITGLEDSSDICVNGAAAHLVKPGDVIIIACFMFVHEAEMASYAPRLVFVDQNNRMKPSRPEVPGPQMFVSN